MFARVLLFVCIIGWPITAMTVFKNEPQGILGLSWLALIFTATDIMFTTTLENDKPKRK